MMTPKKFILIVVFTLMLGLIVGYSVCYSVSEKNNNVIVEDVNLDLRFSRDSLITESRIKDMIVFELKKQLVYENNLIDSLIKKNHKNGKIENEKIRNYNHDSLVKWNADKLRANNVK